MGTAQDRSNQKEAWYQSHGCCSGRIKSPKLTVDGRSNSSVSLLNYVGVVVTMLELCKRIRLSLHI